MKIVGNRNCLMAVDFPMKYCRVALLWLGTSIIAGTGQAQDDAAQRKDLLPEAIREIARKYADVLEWEGVYENTENGVGYNSGPLTPVNMRSTERTASARFILKRNTDNWDPAAGRFEWVGEGEIHGSNRHALKVVNGSGTGEEWTEEGGGRSPLTDVRLSIGLKEGSADFNAGLGAKHAPYQKAGTVTESISEGGPSFLRSRGYSTEGARGLLTLHLNKIENRTIYPQNIFPQFANGPGVISINSERKTGPQAWNPIHGTTQYHGRLLLAPIYENLEVDVTIEGYAKWRPKGSIAKPGEPGASLVARATLRRKDGKDAELPRVARFRFKLADTSREPGVCLNWPLNAKDDDFDMRLAIATTGGEVSDEAQKMEVKDVPLTDKKQPYAEVKVESLDFGARAHLLVFCELEDGRELIGFLKEDGRNRDFIRIPKMIGADWIAEVWRKDNNVLNLAADDDNERVEGQTHNGDGFTLYEEYRGWVVGGKHTEGDPKKKELFVLNDIGGDAVGGFQLFQREAKVKVHHKLRRSEMSEDVRVMNGNHRDAPHRVKQHGVWIRNAWGTGVPDAGTSGMSSNDLAKAFRPANVRVITVEPRNLSDQTFSTAVGMAKYGLSERDAQHGYDRAVAHELLHAVGVDHHGHWESSRTYYFRSASDPNNPSGRAGFSEGSPSPRTAQSLQRIAGYKFKGDELRRFPPVTLLWEHSKRDLAIEMERLFQQELAARRAQRAANPPSPENDPGRFATQFPQYGKSAEYWRESDLYDSVGYYNDHYKISTIVGEPGEADSGEELCLMRYYFANAYPIKGRKDAYYLVQPGTNRAGRMVCRSPEGKTFNAPSHQPQSRFGPASAGRGNCFSYICPNDAIPPRNL